VFDIRRVSVIVLSFLWKQSRQGHLTAESRPIEDFRFRIKHTLSTVEQVRNDMPDGMFYRRAVSKKQSQFRPIAGSSKHEIRKSKQIQMFKKLNFKNKISDLCEPGGFEKTKPIWVRNLCKILLHRELWKYFLAKIEQ
jgi:hypothetical protein